MADTEIWNEERLLMLVKTQEPESLYLDYKACGSLTAEGKDKERIKNDIGRDVSAFANAGGGTIIYGIKEEKHGNGIPECIDDGFDPAEISKDWLDQVIEDRIRRKIDGIRIYPVPLTTTHPGRVAYVVEIPESTRAPHQAKDHIYYKRKERGNSPMEEYEVRDVSRRLETPDLRIEYFIGEENKEHQFSLTTVDLDLSLRAKITNDGPMPADHAVIELFFDRKISPSLPSGTTWKLGDFIYRESRILAKIYTFTWHVAEKTPIFEGYWFPVHNGGFSFRLPFNLDFDEVNCFFAWRIRAPRMKPKQGGAILNLDCATRTVRLVPMEESKLELI